MRRLNSRSGLTLVEVLVAGALLAVVLTSVLHLLHSGLIFVEQIDASATALNDATSVIESMRTLATLTAITLTARYPDGAAVPGFNNLNQETVIVRYANLAANPIKVYVTVSWQGQGGRIFQEELAALLTQR
ncbi:MAG: type II secretion system GspH family protein [Candidatus Omnitrophica bacterium]|nr:type II secretion system GspH family protein [Candidatus Omnitrophota bacterium]